MTDRQKRDMIAEEIWLNYYNNYLYERKMITEEQRNKMRNEITFHCGRKRKQAEKER